MADSEKKKRKSLLDRLKEKIVIDGMSLEELLDDEAGDDTIRVYGLKFGVRDSVKEMGKSPRDQVVMVRVDEETTKDLDAWVQAGAVKSRSEAAALFIREGLKIRESELEQLRGALDDVELAREKLQKKAREVFGDKDGEGGSS